MGILQDILDAVDTAAPGRGDITISNFFYIHIADDGTSWPLLIRLQYAFGYISIHHVQQLAIEHFIQSFGIAGLAGGDKEPLARWHQFITALYIFYTCSNQRCPRLTYGETFHLAAAVGVLYSFLQYDG